MNKLIVLFCALAAIHCATLKLFREDVVTYKTGHDVTVVLNLGGTNVSFDMVPNWGLVHPNLGYNVYPYQGKGEMSTYVRFTFDTKFEKFTGFFYHEGAMHFVKKPSSQSGVFLEATNMEDVSDEFIGGRRLGRIEEDGSVTTVPMWDSQSYNQKRNYKDLNNQRPPWASKELPTEDCENTRRNLRVGVVADHTYAAAVANDGSNVRDHVVSDYNTVSAIYERTAGVAVQLRDIRVTSYAGGPAWNSQECPSISDKMNQFNQWRSIQRSGRDYAAWHLLTNCYPEQSTQTMAHSTSLCDRRRNGAVINYNPKEWSFQGIAQNLGTSCGARQDYVNGGIMGSGPNEHWFSADSQAQLCQRMNAAECVTKAEPAQETQQPEDPTYKAEPQCSPKCENIKCGSDGCGGSCGECSYQENCVDGKCEPICQRKCVGDCGSDGCGGSCGACKANHECQAGKCVAVPPPCVPQCLGKQCGDDGCDGSCGPCEDNQNCEYGRCVSACVPDCKDKNCGADGCGGTCGFCQEYETCEDNICGGRCEPQCADRQCGDDACGGSCGTCDGTYEACVDGKCACIPNCEGKECGDDGCGNDCGTCPGAYDKCDTSGKCGCVPDCADKTCGDDGCGGTCGDCGYQKNCKNGACECLPLCKSNPNGACGEDGCGGSCGDCKDGYKCQNGICLCEPNCDGKTCGGDGCGGTCGDCAAYTKCENGKCECVPDCEGKSCGDDGCGGECGNGCDANSVCNGHQCVAQVRCEKDCTFTSSSGKVYNRECGPDGCGGQCGNGCAASEFCTHKGICECTRKCEGKMCGSDGCGSDCGTCAYGMECNAQGMCEQQACVPQCLYKECGGDECGGSCGVCGAEQDCVEFQCRDKPQPPPPPPPPPPPAQQVVYGENQRQELQENEWAYDEMEIVPNTVTDVYVDIPEGARDDDLEVYGSLGGRPTRNRYFFRGNYRRTNNNGKRSVYMRVPQVTRSRNVNTNVYVGVRANRRASYTARVEKRLGYGSHALVSDPFAEKSKTPDSAGFHLNAALFVTAVFVYFARLF